MEILKTSGESLHESTERAKPLKNGGTEEAIALLFLRVKMSSCADFSLTGK
jgi:hypothetical protein